MGVDRTVHSVAGRQFGFDFFRTREGCLHAEFFIDQVDHRRGGFVSPLTLPATEGGQQQRENDPQSDQFQSVHESAHDAGRWVIPKKAPQAEALKVGS